MDFFQQQDLARQRTRRLIALFVLALVVLTTLLNLLVAALIWAGDEHLVSPYVDYTQLATNPETGMPQRLPFWYYVQWQQWLTISAGVLVVVGGASLYKWLNLRGGGRVVAQSLGGRLLTSNSTDFYERRLLNIVTEMALASGMPVPPVYVLPEESINAFAAGYQPSDAVIGVTRGAMLQLSREQLQGVIAHEFSHIVNGDMRLNIRLMAVLFGLLFVALMGRMLIQAASRSMRVRNNGKNNGLPLWVLGLALMAIGYGGVFFGNLIKAAVSRQREFLADASAVQFTRDPDSIAGALKVIGYGAGSAIEHPEREETAHLFFGSVASFHVSWMSTHPPLEERIRRIDRNWDGRYLAPQKRADAEQEEQVWAANAPSSLLAAGGIGTLLTVTTALDAASQSSASAPTTATTTATTTTPTTVTSAQSATSANTSNGMAVAPTEQERAQQALTQLSDYAHDSYAAHGLLFAMLLADPAFLAHNEQLDRIHQHYGQDLLKITLNAYEQLPHLAQEQRLPLVELAIPALKEISHEQFRQLRQQLTQLVKADGKISVFEWCLYRLTMQYLEAHFEAAQTRTAKYGKVDAIADACATVFSYCARHGHSNPATADHALQQAFSAAGIESSIRTTAGINPHQLKPLNLALTKLQHAYPHLKARVIKGLLACIDSDQQRLPVELDLVRTIAAILETPLTEFD